MDVHLSIEGQYGEPDQLELPVPNTSQTQQEGRDACKR